MRLKARIERAERAVPISPYADWTEEQLDAELARRWAMLSPEDQAEIEKELEERFRGQT